MPLQAPTRPIRLLIIDDDEHVRRVTRLILEKNQVAIVVAEADGTRESIAAACQEQPDVILLDQDLGHVRGTDLIADILRRSPRTMIVMLTSAEAAHLERRALSAGAFAFYEKAWIPTHLGEYLVSDYELFCRALDGEDVAAPLALTRRSSAREPRSGSD